MHEQGSTRAQVPWENNGVLSSGSILVTKEAAGAGLFRSCVACRCETSTYEYVIRLWIARSSGLRGLKIYEERDNSR